MAPKRHPQQRTRARGAGMGDFGEIFREGDASAVGFFHLPPTLNTLQKRLTPERNMKLLLVLIFFHSV
ncbi:hypothetical protein [Paracoccus broussonetiae]|uniref:hypothetical protein n=1 Tax=Paracoccus broussonetiae TaxID=3075834 RepID=UPI00288A4F3C|nr:hypothetical protein [Paracoccus sp. CPCC 101403]